MCLAVLLCISLSAASEPASVRRKRSLWSDGNGAPAAENTTSEAGKTGATAAATNDEPEGAAAGSASSDTPEAAAGESNVTAAQEAAPVDKTPSGGAAQPAEPATGGETPKPAEKKTPAGEAEPAGETQPAGDAKTVEAAKPAETTEPPNATNPGSEATPAEAAEPAGEAEPAATTPAETTPAAAGETAPAAAAETAPAGTAAGESPVSPAGKPAETGDAKAPVEKTGEDTQTGKVEHVNDIEKYVPFDPKNIGKPGIIFSGEIEIGALLQFVAGYKGKPVFYDSISGSSYFEKTIKLETDTIATYEVVKAILEANGFDVVERVLPSGVAVIEVMSDKRRTTRTEATPVLEALSDKPLLEGFEPDQVVTMIVQLQYAETQEVENTLSAILGAGAKSSAIGGVQIVEVERINALFIKAKFSMMEFVRKIIKQLDVELPEDQQEVIEIVDVREADASELAALIEEVLSGTRDNQYGRASSQRRTSTTSSSIRRTSSIRRPTTTSSQYGYEDETILIPDERTQRIIVVTTNERELELVMYLVEMLDQEVTDPRRKTHIYQVKYLTATDVATVLSELIGTTSRTGLTGRTSGTARTSTTSRTTSRTSATRSTLGSSGYDESTRIVPHEQTNSLLIQAPPEEYEEILHILNNIDRKRNQVFLEVALVQVNENSGLNHTIELLAGNLDDRATRAAALSSFGLSTVDPAGLPDTFDRLIAGVPGAGLAAVVSDDGQLPALIHFLKSTNEAQVISTPFILADDNEQNQIQIITTTYVMTQQTVGEQSVIAEPKGEDAGVILSITPTISKNAVLLDLQLEVSEFATSATVSGNLPDKTQNTITGRVSVPDGELFVIGGLTSESKSVSVDKVPILGDIPLLGYLFQSKSQSKRRANLYVFLTAHVLSDRTFRDVEQLTREAEEGVRSFKAGKDIKLQNFGRPTVEQGGDGDTSAQLDETDQLIPITSYDERVK